MARLTPELRGYIEGMIQETTSSLGSGMSAQKKNGIIDRPNLNFTRLQLYGWAIQTIPAYLRENGLIRSRVHSGQQVMSLNNDRIPTCIHQDLIKTLTFLGKIVYRYNTLSRREIQYDILQKKYPSVNFVLKDLNREKLTLLRSRSARSA